MVDLFAVPALLLIVLVITHAWFGLRILERGIIFTDLAIGQFAALGAAVSLGFLHGELLYGLTLAFALGCAVLIAFASQRDIQLEAYIGILYVLGASGVMMVLSQSAEGMEHFKALLASDLLFTPAEEVYAAIALYGVIVVMLWRLYGRLQGLAKELLFFGLLALTVTSSVQLAGVLVVFTLLIVPALTAVMQRRFSPLPFAILFGWAFSLTSLIISFFYDLPTGYTVVFSGALTSLVAVLLLSRRRA